MEEKVCTVYELVQPASMNYTPGLIYGEKPDWCPYLDTETKETMTL